MADSTQNPNPDRQGAPQGSSGDDDNTNTSGADAANTPNNVNNASGTPDSTLQRVVYALPARDAYRGIVRLASSDLQHLGARPGDIIALVNAANPQRKVALRALPSAPGDNSLQVGLDSFERENSQLSVGESAQLWKLSPLVARRVEVTLLPGRGAQSSKLSSADLLELLEGRALVSGNRVRLERYGNHAIDLQVTSCEPDDVVIVRDSSQIHLNIPEPSAKPDTKGYSPSTYDDIGGLIQEVSRVRELVELPLKRPEIFARLGIDAPKGVLLYGPPGTGKTMIARAVAREAGAHFISVAGPEIVGKYYGESEKRLREIFADASRHAPAIIFLDEIDAIGPKRSEVQGEVEKRVVAQLLTLMDGLADRGQVVVIGATNRPDDLDPALRRPGRFEREVAIGVPDRASRQAILQIHTRSMPLADDVDLDHLATQTHGFVGADLAALCREAALERLRTALHETQGLNPDALPELQVRRKDFSQALRFVIPSALRELDSDIAPAKWQDVGGLTAIKDELRLLVELPFEHAELFASMNLKPPKGVLLVGPPGTGKTLVARAVANEVSANFILVRGAQLLSKYVGESERAIRDLFARARANAPAIIFFDEIDALLSKRDNAAAGGGIGERIVGQFLSEMDGALAIPGVMLLGTTNRREALDDALLRSGRFESILHFALPDARGREEILDIHLRNRPHDPAINLTELAVQCEGLSGADLERLCRRAALLALQAVIAEGKQDHKPVISKVHISRALDEVKRDVTEPFSDQL
ncbi:MAG: AAA family ATPase [Deinococcota bacterium]